MTLARENTLIKMIYNNTGSCSGLKNAWGLSVWIEENGEVTLFDTGGEAQTLGHNITQLGLDINKIKDIIISHDHWDHNAGIDMILEKTGYKPKLYVTSNVAGEYTKKYPAVEVTGVSKPLQINELIWSTGALKTDYRANGLEEQAIILCKGDAMVLLTGCSHPGVVELAKRAIDIHPGKNFKLLAGGFHLMRESRQNVEEISRQLKKLNIEKIAPSHCTGENSIEVFRNDWGEKFVDINIGDSIPI